MEAAVETMETRFEPPAEGTALEQYAPGEKPWVTHRRQTQKMCELLDIQDPRIQALRARMEGCSSTLIFAHTLPEDAHGRTFKLHEANFCRVRVCPVCQWRRSLRLCARFQEAIPALEAEIPGHRWILLTLTVKNVPVESLRESLQKLNVGWKRLSQTKRFRAAVLGYVKNIEVTRSATGEAHPHIHALLLVAGEYFQSAQYIPQSEFREMWRAAMRLGYDPQVNVQAVPKANSIAAAREILKYATKPEDLLTDQKWTVEYIRQVHGLRFLATGGVVRQLFSEQEPDEEEMLLTGQEQEQEDEPGTGEVLALSRWNWKVEEKGYYCAGVRWRASGHTGAPPARGGEKRAGQEQKALERA